MTLTLTGSLRLPWKDALPAGLTPTEPAEFRDQAAQLQTESLAAIPEHAGLRLSTYGDLVAVTDQGAIRVAVVEPQQWFAGYLA